MVWNTCQSLDNRSHILLNLHPNLAVIEILTVRLFASLCRTDEDPPSLLGGPGQESRQAYIIDMEQPGGVPHDVCPHEARVEDGHCYTARLGRFCDLVGKLPDEEQLHQLGHVVPAFGQNPTPMKSAREVARENVTYLSRILAVFSSANASKIFSLFLSGNSVIK